MGCFSSSMLSCESSRLDLLRDPADGRSRRRIGLAGHRRPTRTLSASRRTAGVRHPSLALADSWAHSVGPLGRRTLHRRAGDGGLGVTGPGWRLGRETRRPLCLVHAKSCLGSAKAASSAILRRRASLSHQPDDSITRGGRLEETDWPGARYYTSRYHGRREQARYIPRERGS